MLVPGIDSHKEVRMRWITEWPGASRAVAVSSAVIVGDVVTPVSEGWNQRQIGRGNTLGPHATDWTTSKIAEEFAGHALATLVSARLTAAGMQCRSSMGSASVFGDAAGASERHTAARESHGPWMT